MRLATDEAGGYRLGIARLRGFAVTLTASPPRMPFLDWLRIGAFALLVLYHVGMYYVSWPWHVKSAQASDSLRPWMLLSSPWRLSLLFLVSGAATSFMFRRSGASVRLLGARSLRLLLPLAFGMIVIVPLQPYFEVVQQHGYGASFAEFLRLYFGGYRGFCKPAGECLILPTWNHLWFLPYLFVYTLVLWLASRLWPDLLDRFGAWQAKMLRGAALLWLPIGLLAAFRLALLDRFPPTHALAGDWYLHPVYLMVFLLGAAWAREPASWERCVRLRWVALALALMGWAALLVVAAATEGGPPQAGWAWLARSAFATAQWSAVVAAVGFARRHLDRDHRWRQMLAEAVFPVYIVHQTLIIGLAMALAPLQWRAAAEAPVLVVLTFAGSFGLYLLVRRVPVLRPLFGLSARALTGASPALAVAGQPR